MKRIVTAVSIALALATPALASRTDKAPHRNQAIFHGHRKGDQAWQWNWQKWMPAHWVRLAQCESGSRGEPNWTHHSYYEGAFGLAPGSWDGFKPVAWWPDSAYDASPFQQWRVARIIAAKYGIAEPWGCWRGSQHAWVRGGLPEYGVYK